jgi:hypothetical protein
VRLTAASPGTAVPHFVHTSKEPYPGEAASLFSLYATKSNLSKLRTIHDLPGGRFLRAE